jgi:hypothetical protein
MKISLAWMGLLLVFGSAQADWQLDAERSSISFVSIKNIDIPESHVFGRMAGSLAADGEFRVDITLDSVDTSVPIRDERMREIVFDTVNHPLAVASGRVEMGLLAALDVGQSIALGSDFELQLSGNKTTHSARIEVTRAAADQFLVVTQRPILINAAVLGLGEAVEKLQEIAGLSAISKAVPVYFSLRFTAIE